MTLIMLPPFFKLVGNRPVFHDLLAQLFHDPLRGNALTHQQRILAISTNSDRGVCRITERCEQSAYVSRSTVGRLSLLQVFMGVTRNLHKKLHRFGHHSETFTNVAPRH